MTESRTHSKKGKEPLGRGMYRLSEVARYTGLPKRRVHSWFTARADRRIGPVFKSDFGKRDGVYIVSFLDMVDAWVAGQLRGEGVSMPKIRAAYAALKQDLQADHPFAHSAIYTDGREVFAYAAKRVNDATLTEVVSRQTFFPRVRESLKPIEYSRHSHLAERWRIAKGVIIDPGLSFGQPVVAGTGISTYVVARAYAANRQNSELVARLFGISRKDVVDAVRFEERYGRQQAA